MHEAWERARARYQAAALPEELAFAVAGAVRRGERQRKGRRALRRAAATALAGCACFALLLNVSPTFAGAVYQVPVLGQLARVITVKEYSINDRDHLIDVRLPALELAAAAIGGTSMAGGRGNIFGTVIGAILFSALKVGLIVMGVDTFYQYIVTGVVVIFAAYLEIVQGNMMQKGSKNEVRVK